MLIGYARVSTTDQDLALQLDALAAVGCEKVFTDKASGTKVSRSGLSEALTYARPGDSLVVWKLDRLGRSMKGLVDLVADLEGRAINLRSLTDGIDTTTAAGRFFFHIMAALAVMERDLILERTKAGLAAARKAGRVGGRPRALPPSKMAIAGKLLSADTPPKEVAATLGISLATLYRYFPASSRNEIRAG